MINLAGIAAQFTELMLAILLAPLLTGWVNQCRAWLQNRSAPSLLQPYRNLNKLFTRKRCWRTTPRRCFASRLT